MKPFFEDSGNVASVDVLTALCTIGRHGMSGSVRFSSGTGETVRYGFDEGVLVGLETPPEAAAPEVLIRAGKIQRVTYEALTVGNFEDRFAVAAASGVISKREASWGLKMSAIETLVWILTWPDGTYTFDEDAPAPTAPPLHISVDHWVLELFLRSTDRAFVLRRIGATDLPIARAPEFAKGFAALGLTADADGVVEAIDGKHTVEQVVKRSRADEFSTLKLLAGLMTLGLIHPNLENPIAPRAAVVNEPDRGTVIATPTTEPDVSDAPPSEAETDVFPEDTPQGEDDTTRGIAAEEESSPEPSVEAPPPPTEIVNLPLFALTAPEPDSEVADLEIVPEPAARETPRKPGGGAGKWVLAMLVAALVAVAAMLVRRRASVSGGRAVTTSEVPPARTEPAPRPPTPVPPKVSSTAWPRSSTSQAPQIVISRSPEAKTSPALGKGWSDLAEAGGRAFDHPGANRYAIQLELACEETTLRMALAADPGRRRIWLTPYPFRGRSCYRVLWGKFKDLASAKSAKKSIPPQFSRGGNRPTVIALGKTSGAKIAKEDGNR